MVRVHTLMTLQAGKLPRNQAGSPLDGGFMIRKVGAHGVASGVKIF